MKNLQMSNELKKMMSARNAIKLLTQDYIDAFEDLLYDDEQNVLCVDCVHPDEYDPDWEHTYNQQTYTWYIPTSVHIQINAGDTLVVEQTVGIGLAFVKAVSAPYTKTREQHEREIHPYCRVILNMGNTYL